MRAKNLPCSFCVPRRSSTCCCCFCCCRVATWCPANGSIWLRPIDKCPLPCAVQGGHLVSCNGGADGSFATATDVLYDGSTMTVLEEDAIMCAPLLPHT